MGILKNIAKTSLIWILVALIIGETIFILTQLETWKLGKSVERKAVEQYLKK